MNDIVLMPYGESFRKHRKFVHSTITKRAITTFQPIQTKNARALALNLLENKNRHEMFFNMSVLYIHIEPSDHLTGVSIIGSPPASSLVSSTDTRSSPKTMNI